MADNDKKKQIPLRLSASLYEELARWAEDDFRSLNGQIEFLLTECVKYRKKGGNKNKNESDRVIAALEDLKALINEAREPENNDDLP